MKKVQKFLNVVDYKTEDGLWVKDKTTTTEDGYIRSVTRSGLLWDNLNSRCKQSYWNKYPTYQGTQNLFENYQDFASWCQDQTGYMNIDKSGRYWSLDKDLLSPSSKIYSKENCLFVPNWINTLLISCGSVRGNYPIGVHLHKTTGKFIGKCGEYLGLFDTPESAHRAWQEKKLDVLEYASRHSDVENHSKLSNAIYHIAVKLRYELDNNIETF